MLSCRPLRLSILLRCFALLQCAGLAAGKATEKPLFQVFDNVLTRDFFRIVGNSELWRYHDHLLFKIGQPPPDPLYQAVDAIVRSFGDTRGLMQVWTRPNWQTKEFHFDSDERLHGEYNELSIPSWAHVLYVEADPTFDAPTMVIDGFDSNASSVTYVPFLPNRLLRFNGGKLHAVSPKPESLPFEAPRMVILFNVWPKKHVPPNSNFPQISEAIAKEKEAWISAYYTAPRYPHGPEGHRAKINNMVYTGKTLRIGDQPKVDILAKRVAVDEIRPASDSLHSDEGHTLRVSTIYTGEIVKYYATEHFQMPAAQFNITLPLTTSEFDGFLRSSASSLKPCSFHTAPQDLLQSGLKRGDEQEL